MNVIEPVARYYCRNQSHRTWNRVLLTPTHGDYLKLPAIRKYFEDIILDDFYVTTVVHKGQSTAVFFLKNPDDVFTVQMNGIDREEFKY